MIKHRFFSCLLLILSAASASAQLTNTGKQFTLMPENITSVDFRNDIVETQTMFLYIYEYLYVGA
jgi:hypothetical protein